LTKVRRRHNQVDSHYYKDHPASLLTYTSGDRGTTALSREAGLGSSARALAAAAGRHPRRGPFAGIAVSLEPKLLAIYNDLICLCVCSEQKTYI
jgi:hypothetical protein